MLAVVVHASVPLIAAAAITIPVAASHQVIDPGDVNGLLLSNLGFLAPSDAAVWLTQVLQALDAYAVWTLTLLVIGCAVAARTSKTLSAVALVLGWSLWIVLRAAVAAVIA
jgi:hypothetical protein